MISPYRARGSSGKRKPKVIFQRHGHIVVGRRRGSRKKSDVGSKKIDSSREDANGRRRKK